MTSIVRCEYLPAHMSWFALWVSFGSWLLYSVLFQLSYKPVNLSLLLCDTACTLRFPPHTPIFLASCRTTMYWPRLQGSNKCSFCTEALFLESAQIYLLLLLACTPIFWASPAFSPPAVLLISFVSTLPHVIENPKDSWLLTHCSLLFSHVVFSNCLGSHSSRPHIHSSVCITSMMQTELWMETKCP